MRVSILAVVACLCIPLQAQAAVSAPSNSPAAAPNSSLGEHEV
jgi:hypothetical protein